MLDQHKAAVAEINAKIEEDTARIKTASAKAKLAILELAPLAGLSSDADQALREIRELVLMSERHIPEN